MSRKEPEHCKQILGFLTVRNQERTQKTKKNDNDENPAADLRHDLHRAASRPDVLESLQIALLFSALLSHVESSAASTFDNIGD